jgi:hypothetical protein
LPWQPVSADLLPWQPVSADLLPWQPVAAKPSPWQPVAANPSSWHPVAANHLICSFSSLVLSVIFYLCFYPRVDYFLNHPTSLLAYHLCVEPSFFPAWQVLMHLAELSYF